MFGNQVTDEVTQDLMNPVYGFNPTLNKVATWLIVLNPVTKFALCTRPVSFQEDCGAQDKFDMLILLLSPST